MDNIAGIPQSLLMAHMQLNANVTARPSTVAKIAAQVANNLVGQGFRQVTISFPVGSAVTVERGERDEK